jgi:hypothetical protein
VRIFGTFFIFFVTRTNDVHRLMEEIGKTCAAAGAGVGVAAVAQGVATATVPVAMSTFGTVVSGVGTIHAAGGVAGKEFLSCFIHPIQQHSKHLELLRCWVL